MRKLACLAVKETGATAGDTYARDLTAPDGWNQGDSLLVCVVVTGQGVTGLSPLPGGGTTQTALRMRIEQDDPPTSNGVGLAGTTPSGPPGGWSWCV